MPTSAKVATGTIGPTVGNTCDLTVSGFGTPTAALIFVSDAGTNNPSTHASMSVGFWTAAAQCATGVYSTSGATTTANARQNKAAVVVCRPSTNPDAAFYEATATNITDGIRLTVSLSSSGVSRNVYAILIKGTLNAYVGSKSLGTGTSAVDITDPGFRPDLVFMLTDGQGAGSVFAHLIFSLGVAHNNGTTTTQGLMAFAATDAVGTSQTSVHISNTHCVTQHFQDATSWQASASDFDASGFSLTPSANAGNDIVRYLALELADPSDAYVGLVDSKTTTGTQAYTGAGFTPDVVALWQTLNTSAGITQGSSIGAGAMDGARQVVIAVRDKDNVTTTDSDSQSSTTASVRILFNDGTTDGVAAFSSFDADGWTLNYSDGSASARKMLAIAIGDSTAGGSAPTITALSARLITATSAQPRISYS